MTTLVHTETGQSVTLDDAGSFIASVPDADKWVDADAPGDGAAEASQVEQEVPQAPAQDAVGIEPPALEVTPEPAAEPAEEAPAHAETILEHLEHVIEDAVHKIEGEM